MVFTDKSPFGAREFKVFASNYVFRHDMSSSPSNCRLDNAVKTVKRLMIKASEDHADPFLALLDWRNTPSETLDVSPSQIMFGRRTRTKLPTTEVLLESMAKDIPSKAKAAKLKQAVYYNKNAIKYEKPILPVGSVVRFRDADQDEWQKGEVARVRPFRSYDIKKEDGSIRRRTSRHVRFSREPPMVMNEDDEDRHEDRTTTTIVNSEPRTTKNNEQEIQDNRNTTNVKKSNDYVTRSGRTVNKPARYR